MKLKFILPSIATFLLVFNVLSAQTTRDLKSFESIGISGSIDVVLVASNQDKAEIEVFRGTKVEDVVTEVSNGKLVIKPKKGVRNVNAKVTLSYSSKLNRIAFSGSSDISGKNPIKGDNLVFSGSGSGSFKGEVNATTLTTSLSGSGNIDVEGVADTFTVNVSGSADVNAFDLKSKIVQISVSGSGDVDCFATEEINAKVSGSGDIRYKGTPTKTKIKVSGSGDIENVQ
ncbi:head GIN domain-containing protein [Flammeovirga pacifica]|uniref:Putative auto-transporter adhesin head GIN domain-containing protein n=1 Tax=Flammeovirga pacifica TaxID=915059 RepID=A0A1S1Z4A5_FLAPC|nr:head GIN domain-containing protein [Flammeovirga pacifica]OHX68062.1 hypothetical protein NH26_17785 [Flammeovirga pacifica]